MKDDTIYLRTTNGTGELSRPAFIQAECSAHQEMGLPRPDFWSPCQARPWLSCWSIDKASLRQRTPFQPSSGYVKIPAARLGRNSGARARERQSIVILSPMMRSNRRQTGRLIWAWKAQTAASIWALKRPPARPWSKQAFKRVSTLWIPPIFCPRSPNSRAMCNGLYDSWIPTGAGMTAW